MYRSPLDDGKGQSVAKTVPAQDGVTQVVSTAR